LADGAFAGDVLVEDAGLEDLELLVVNPGDLLQRGTTAGVAMEGSAQSSHVEKDSWTGRFETLRQVTIWQRSRNASELIGCGRLSNEVAGATVPPRPAAPATSGTQAPSVTAESAEIVNGCAADQHLELLAERVRNGPAVGTDVSDPGPVQQVTQRVHARYNA
jgi:hypothetical protein